jgi:hypothetical protein
LMQLHPKMQEERTDLHCNAHFIYSSLACRREE